LQIRRTALCHSERSEESEQVALREEVVGFFAALRMTHKNDIGLMKNASITVLVLLLPLAVSSQVTVDSTEKYKSHIMKHKRPGGKHLQLLVDDKNHSLTMCYGGTIYKSTLHFDSTCTEITRYACDKRDSVAQAFPQITKMDWGASTLLRFTDRNIPTKRKKLLNTLFGEKHDVVMAWEIALDDDAKPDLIILRHVVEKDSSKTQPNKFEEVEFFLNRGSTYIKAIGYWFPTPLTELYISKFRSFGLPVVMYSKYEEYLDKEQYVIYVAKLNSQPSG
jgi:hypothetical protein